MRDTSVLLAEKPVQIRVCKGRSAMQLTCSRSHEQKLDFNYFEHYMMCDVLVI